MSRHNAGNGKRKHNSTAGKSVAVVGAGGTIGSRLIAHVGRMQCVSHVTIIDHDRYEPHNLLSQEIDVRDVGKLKGSVQARRLKRIDPSLTVRTFAERVENVPLGVLNCDVILACLDSRQARMVVNEAAWRLGVPWIDAGIGGDEWIARVNGYSPGVDTPCMECAWNDDDYAAIEQTYPCDDGAMRVAPTNSPSHLGALAAAIQAAECEKLLTDNDEPNLLGRQIVIDLRNQGQIVSRFTRNPNCLFDHQVWELQALYLDLSKARIRDMFDEFGTSDIDDAPTFLELPGHTFVQKLGCSDCLMESSHRLSIVRRMNGRVAECPACGGQMLARGFDQFERIGTDQLRGRDQRRSLSSIGFRDGDVLGVSIGDDVRMLELKIDHDSRRTKQ